LKYLINKQKLYSIALASTAMIFMLISIVDAAPFAYITNQADSTVTVIDTATNNVTATVTVENRLYGVTVTPDGKKVYVTNYGSNNVSAINTTTNMITATVQVGRYPCAFGQFIGPNVPLYFKYAQTFVTTSPTILPHSWKIFNANITLSDLSAPKCFVMRVPNNPDHWEYLPPYEAGQTVSWIIKDLISQNPHIDQIGIKNFAPDKVITEKLFPIN
jgi:YVTN family beta-propeller protein